MTSRLPLRTDENRKWLKGDGIFAKTYSGVIGNYVFERSDVFLGYRDLCRWVWPNYRFPAHIHVPSQYHAKAVKKGVFRIRN
jgi:hypothetical protein